MAAVIKYAEMLYDTMIIICNQCRKLLHLNAENIYYKFMLLKSWAY